MVITLRLPHHRIRDRGTARAQPKKPKQKGINAASQALQAIRTLSLPQEAATQRQQVDCLGLTCATINESKLKMQINQKRKFSSGTSLRSQTSLSSTRPALSNKNHTGSPGKIQWLNTVQLSMKKPMIRQTISKLFKVQSLINARSDQILIKAAENVKSNKESTEMQGNLPKKKKILLKRHLCKFAIELGADCRCHIRLINNIKMVTKTIQK